MRLGSIAVGNDFFGRTTECDDLQKYLQNEHLVVSGPRRLGKSSIINKLKEDACRSGTLAAHVDVQGIEGAGAFIYEIARNFPETTINKFLSALGQQPKRLTAAFKKIEIKVPGGVGAAIELNNLSAEPWLKEAMDLQERLSSVPAYIMIDEFSVFLHKLLLTNREEAEALLAWLRSWRVQPGIACRFLFSGSIGLNSLLEQYGLTAQFNDCLEYPIGPFKLNAALQMLDTFANREGYQIDAGVAAYLCNRVGWLSPYYLCLLLDQTIRAARDRIDEVGGPTHPGSPIDITSADVDTAYERLLSARSRFCHWEERLKRDLQGMNFNYANLILTALSKSAVGLTQRQLYARLARLEPDPDERAARLRVIMCKLQEEGYITPPDETARSSYLSFLLKDYWARNHV